MKLLAITANKVTVELAFDEVRDIALGLDDRDEFGLAWRENVWWPMINAERRP